MDDIVIWEVGSDAIRACENATIEALKELGLRVKVTINSEPPLISRNELWNRLPVLEIGGLYWSLAPGQPFSKRQLITLFRKLFCADDQTGKE